MDFVPTDTHKAVRKKVREFAEREIEPIAAKLDSEDFNWDLQKKLAKEGFMGFHVPKELGGQGMDMVSYCIMLEELGRVQGGVGLYVEAHNSLAIGHILTHGTKEQQKSYIPDLASGKYMGAWALTEPSAGSDAGGTQTTAILDGDEWILNGMKCFITSGNVAQTHVIMALTEKGIGSKGVSAFIVEKGTKGFSIGSIEDKLGMRASSTCELVFEDCHIPKGNLIGKSGEGFKQAMKVLDVGRTAISALAVGIAQGALDASLYWSRERKTFGKSIGNHQAIGWMLAEMATETECARLITYKCADLIEKNLPVSIDTSMAKLFTSEVAMRNAIKGIQIHGGHGYITGAKVERCFRDAKLLEIGEGTTEVQKMIISRALLAMK